MIKYIKGLKIFSIIALSCTIILWIVLWGMSLMPSDSSGSMSNKVTGVVDDALGVQDKINNSLTTQSIKIKCDLHKKGYFFDDHPVLSIHTFPENAPNKDVIYTITTQVGKDVDKVYAEIDQETGRVTFIKMETVVIKAALKSDPDIFDKIELKCYGENPFDADHPERLSITAYKGDVDILSNLTVGKRKRIYLNNGKTSLDCVSFKTEDTSVSAFAYGYIYPRKVGETILNAKVVNGDQKTTLTIPIKVSNNGTINVPEVVAKDNITIHEQDIINKYSLIKLPENVNKNAYPCMVKTSNSKILEVMTNTLLRAVGYGKVTLTYMPLFDPEKSFDITVNVEKVKPQKIYIVGNDNITPGSSYRYKVRSLPLNYSKDVIWKVEEGNATIDDNGNLVAKTYGTVVISCQSTLNESLIIEKTINVTLFTSAHSFVRKLMGHFGLSALLGFGIAGTLILLCKNKLRAAYAIPLSFIYAGISELLQKLAPGRACLFSDVLVDFIGTLIGIVAALILTGLILLLWRLINKKSFDKLKFTLKLQSFKTLFKSSARLEEYNCLHVPDDESESSS